MPNYLSNLWGAVNTPIVPQAPVTAAQNWMTTPKLDENPLWTQAKGFGAGALQGLRDLTTPVNIASAMIPGGEAFRGVEAGAEGLGAGVQAARAAAPTMELMEAAPTVRQMMPTAGGVDTYANALEGSMAGIPSAKGVNASQAIQGLKGAGSSGMLGPESNSLADFMSPQVQANMERMHQEMNPVAKQVQAGWPAGDRTVGGIHKWR